MRHKRLRLSAVLLFSLGLTVLQAQETVHTTGGNASGSGGSASYSIGQIVYQAQSGTNGSAAQGVQQPYEISVATGIEEAKGINLVVSTYPNPTTDYLILEVKDIQLYTLYFQLFDLNGKLLQSKKITDIQTTIVVRNLVPSSYFLKVIANIKVLKTFKIIKK